MTHLLPEFHKSVPVGVQLDGELVALAYERTARPPSAQFADATGMHSGWLTLFVFDLLAVA